MDQDQNIFSDQEVKDIIDKDILELMGAKNMDPQKKQELYEKMAQTIQDRVIARIDDSLDETGKAEWLKLAEENNKEKMEAFLKSHNIDVVKLMTEEAMVYKMEVMTLMKQAKE